MSRPLRHAVVIGSSGFLGSWLVDQLIQEGVRVTGVSRRDVRALPTLAAPTEWVQADIARAEPQAYLPDCDAVFFLAGVASVPASVEAPLSDLDGNLRAPVRILQALRERKSATSFIYASSAAVYGTAHTRPMHETHPLNPLSPYGVSKYAAEAYVRLYASSFGVSGASARVFSVYGPGQSKQVIYDWARKVATGGSSLSFFGAPEVSRDFIYASDAASAFIHIARNAPLGGESYNVASGEETTLGKLAQELLLISGSAAEVAFSGEVRVGDPVRWQADISALRRLGFGARISFQSGLIETYRWATRK